MKRFLLALPLALGLASCGDGGGSPAAPPPPPPPTPLSWAEAPESLTVQVREEAEVTASLSSAIDATYTAQVADEIATVTVEPTRAGVIKITIAGVEAGETSISLTAVFSGYATASATIPVTVEPSDFVRRFWDELGFDGYECPRADCATASLRYEGLPVEDRFLVVLPDTQPNWHIVTHIDGQRRLSIAEISLIQREIAESVEELTGEPWGGQLTTGRDVVDRDGWVDVIPVSDDDIPGYWDTGDPRTVICGRASVGTVNGTMVLNADEITVSSSRGTCRLAALFVHELGHVMGFWHVNGILDSMSTFGDDVEGFSEREQYHAQLAYELGRGTFHSEGPQETGKMLRSRPWDFGPPGGSGKDLDALRAWAEGGDSVSCFERPR